MFPSPYSSDLRMAKARLARLRSMAVTSASRSLKRSDLDLTKELATRWGLRHEVIITDELAKADYRANPVDRCFHCKTSLYESLAVIAQREQGCVILNGTNVDDLGDHRPGLIAADDFNVQSPLVDAGFSKADIRALRFYVAPCPGWGHQRSRDHLDELSC